MSAINFIKAVATKSLTGNRGSGIRSIPSAIEAEAKTGELLAILQKAGIPINQLDDFIRSEADVLKFVNIIKNSNKPRVIPADSAEGKTITEKLFGKKGEVIEFPQKRTFKEEIDAMKKSGDLVDEDNMKMGEKIIRREMFKTSNLNKEPINEKFIEYTIQNINKMKPIDAMKEANSVIGRKGPYKDLTSAQSKKILQDTEDHIFERDIPVDPEDMAKGGRAGFYSGGMTNVEPSLDDIGHGADALNARTRLMSPGNQATTSTGLNYLLAEDNDNMRIPFSTGKLAGGIDSVIEKNKNLEERISRNKRVTDMLNKKYEDKAHGRHMTPMPVPMEDVMKLDRPSKPEIKVGPYDPQSNINPFTKDNVVEFDDGTFMYKDNGKYFKVDEEDEPYEVPGPSKGAKIKPIEMEAAEGGRIGFAGGGMSKRAFLKLLAALGGTTAAVKTGILGLGGKEVAKKAVTETVKEAAGSTYPPPYFYKLVEKIKFMGDDTLATQDKAKAYKYKDYTMEEDFAGNIEIIKNNDNIAEDVYMSLRVDEVPLKGKKGSRKVEEYEEYTARPDSDGKMKDVEPGVPDEVVQEAGDPDSMTLKKANGGRIGFSAGYLAKLGINSTSRRFLEKVFGKEKFQNMIENDPEMHRGMLEVVEMFRNKDAEGLKIYMQKFLPHMDDEMIEDFIVGSGGTEGIEGQLIRLGSGRDYKSKLDMIEEANNVRKLENLDVTDEMIRKPNSDGGRIGLFLGGGLTAGKGLLKNMLKYMSQGSSNNKSPAEILKMINPKQFQKLLNDPQYMGRVNSQAPEGLDKIIQDMIAKTKTDRSDMVGNIIGTSRKIKKIDDDLIDYKNKIIKDLMERGMDKETSKQMADTLASQVSKAAGKKPTPKITEQGLLELENIQKNIITKDRKLQAQGGLTTMLGE